MENTETIRPWAITMSRRELHAAGLSLADLTEAELAQRSLEYRSKKLDIRAVRRKFCVACAKPLVQHTGPGRPSEFCGDACRKEYPYRLAKAYGVANLTNAQPEENDRAWGEKVLKRVLGGPDDPAEVELDLPATLGMGEDGELVNAVESSTIGYVKVGPMIYGKEDPLTRTEHYYGVTMAHVDAYCAANAWPPRSRVETEMKAGLADVLCAAVDAEDNYDDHVTVGTLLRRLRLIETAIRPAKPKPAKSDARDMTPEELAAFDPGSDDDLPVEYLAAAAQVAQVIADRPDLSFDGIIAAAKARTAPKPHHSEGWHEAPTPATVKSAKATTRKLRAMADVSKSHSPAEAKVAADKLARRKAGTA
jgi:hypothetical protein